MYGIRPRDLWASINYGGYEIFSGVSNIVFSNGLFDPWSGGGLNYNLSNSLLAIHTGYVGHHMDLMFSNDLDPQTKSVLNARQFELMAMTTMLLKCTK